MKSHYRGHKMAVWLNLIPQLHQPGDDDVSMRHHHFHEREPHYYAGSVRAESFTRLPPALHPASMTDSHIVTAADGTECVPNITTDEETNNNDDINLTDDEAGEELLQHLATRHYYSYTAALGVTVGVGCLLLVLNMLIFAGIYYQRDRGRRQHNHHHHQQQQHHHDNHHHHHHHRSSRSTNSSPSTETIPMSQRPSTPGSSARQSPTSFNRSCMNKEHHELPPSYSILQQQQLRSPSPTNLPTVGQDTLRKEKPPPPLRTSSNLTSSNSGTIKKRVQIQEISV